MYDKLTFISPGVPPAASCWWAIEGQPWESKRGLIFCSLLRKNECITSMLCSSLSKSTISEGVSSSLTAVPSGLIIGLSIQLSNIRSCKEHSIPVMGHPEAIVLIFIRWTSKLLWAKKLFGVLINMLCNLICSSKSTSVGLLSIS